MKTISGLPRPRWLAGLFATALVACGGGGGGGGASPLPPPANQAPVAAITVPATVVAGDPLLFDASASSDPDGDPLAFSWSFGDGTRGGGAKLAHIYPTPGTLTATLTLNDGRGGVTTATRAITVTPGAVAAGSVDTTVVVTDSAGPLAGATVSVLGGASATTGADGIATVATTRGIPLQLRVSKGGYTDQLKPLTLPAAAASGYVEAQLLMREPALTLADAAAGGTLAGKHGVRVTLPANALVDANGNAVTGPVQIAMTPIDVGADAPAFPGLFQGIAPTGERQVLLSFGTVEYLLSKNGAPLQLKAGSAATIEMPIYTALDLDGTPLTAGKTIGLWSLDERTSQWIQEGTGTVVASASSPSELALRATVTHFSWWNIDTGVPPYRPDARCCIRDVPNGPCKENSGDICSHTGTGAGQARTAALRQFMAGTWMRASAAAPATVRLPASIAYATGSALGGVVLPMPPDLDVTVVSTARNGSYRGTRVFRGAAGASEVVTLSLLPVGGATDETITLPWSQSYAMQSAGEIDRFRLTLPAGTGFQARIAQDGSTLTGNARMIRPDGSTVTQPFAAAPAVLTEATVGTAGTYTFEITAATGAPGAYRLEVFTLGACGSVTAATLPSTLSGTLAAQEVRCYDLTLAADDVIQVLAAAPGQSAPNGSMTLLTAGGAQALVDRQFNSGAPADRLILAGIAQAGTYRLRLANVTNASGPFSVQLTKPAATVLAAPGTANVNVSTGTEQFVIVKPAAGAAGLVGMTLSAASGVSAQGDVQPAQTPLFKNYGAAVRVPAPLLPVVRLFSISGSGAATLAALTPQPLPFDTDLAGTVAGATSLVLYAFDGVAGTEIAKRAAVPAGSFDLAAVDIVAPTGAILSGASSIETLPVSGLYAAVVRASAATAYTMRVNMVAAPVALALTPPLTQQTLDLPLGAVRRFTLDLARGELAGLQLDTNTALQVRALLAGVDGATAETPSSGAGPKRAASLPRYVGANGTYTLTVAALGSTAATGAGTVTLGVVKPVPAPTALNTPVTATLPSLTWTAYGFTVPADGYYLTRLTSTVNTFGAAILWDTSRTGTYTGEFALQAAVDGSGVVPETARRLTAGAYTATVQNFDAGASTSATLRLVPLQAPVALTVGAPAVSGAIAQVAERDYFTFDGVGGQTYTVRVAAGFNGTLRVRRLQSDGDFTVRSDAPFGVFGLTGFPVVITPSATEQASTFTIPAAAPFGDGVYVVEVDADESGTGTYTVRMTTP